MLIDVDFVKYVIWFKSNVMQPTQIANPNFMYVTIRCLFIYLLTYLLIGFQLHYLYHFIISNYIKVVIPNQTLNLSPGWFRHIYYSWQKHD